MPLFGCFRLGVFSYHGPGTLDGTLENQSLTLYVLIVHTHSSLGLIR